MTKSPRATSFYASVPNFGDRDIDISVNKSGNYKSVITMKVSGLIKQSKEFPGSYEFSSKNFSQEKIMLKYFEDLIDGKAFETAFLGSSKNLLVTTKDNYDRSSGGIGDLRVAIPSRRQTSKRLVNRSGWGHEVQGKSYLR